MRFRHVVPMLAAVLCFLLLPRINAARASGGIEVRLVTPPDQPVRSYFKYTLVAGKSTRDDLEIKNGGSRPVKVRVYAGDCRNDADGVLNGPLFGQESRSTGHWVSVSSSLLDLAPRQVARVHLKVEVPPDTPPGDHFALLLIEPVSTEPVDTTASVKDRAEFRMRLVERIGITIWTRVPGSLTRGLRIGGLRKEVEDGTLLLQADVENTGNTFLKPWRRWTLRSTAGTLVASDDRQAWGYLLPGSPLRLRAPIGVTRPLARGDYIFEMTVGYDDQQVTERATLTLP